MSRIRAILLYFWQGSPDLPRSLRLEWRFVGIRWLGIISFAPGLLISGLDPGHLRAAYLVLILAAIYNLAVQWLFQRRPSVLASGALTTIGDALLNVAMVTIGGGFGSPFYYILYTVTISAAMRYGYALSLGMAILFASADLAEAMLGGSPIGASFVFRSGFLAITALLASYLREQAEHAEEAREERLQTANRINAATAMLGASLELEMVLQAIVNGACQLFQSDWVLLVPTPALSEDKHALSAGFFPSERRATGLVEGV